MAARESSLPSKRTTPTPSSRLYRDLLERPAANVYGNQLHWLVFKPLFSLCLGVSSYLLGWSIVSFIYALGSRQVALIVGLAWSAVSPCAPWAPQYASTSRVAAGQGKTRRDIWA